MARRGSETPGSKWRSVTTHLGSPSEIILRPVDPGTGGTALDRRHAGLPFLVFVAVLRQRAQTPMTSAA
jgi:hypothetical protein